MDELRLIAKIRQYFVDNLYEKLEYFDMVKVEEFFHKLKQEIIEKED